MNKDPIVHEGTLDGQRVLTTWLPTLRHAKAMLAHWRLAGATWSKVITHQHCLGLGGKYRVVAHFDVE